MDIDRPTQVVLQNRVHFLKTSKTWFSYSVTKASRMKFSTYAPFTLVFHTRVTLLLLLSLWDSKKINNFQQEKRLLNAYEAKTQLHKVQSILKEIFHFWSWFHSSNLDYSISDQFKYRWQLIFHRIHGSNNNVWEVYIESIQWSQCVHWKPCIDFVAILWLEIGLPTYREWDK